GGVLVDGATASIIDSTITLNNADEGAGIHHKSGGTLTLTGTTVTGNTAGTGGGNGGGIWNDATLNIVDSFVTNNTALNGGGGIHNIGGVLTVSGTEISGNDAEHAGGVLNNGAGDLVVSTATFTNSVITMNDATGNDGEPAGGGGIYNFNFSTDTVKAELTLTDTVVSANTSAEGGAGIRNGDGTATLTGATVSTNTSTGDGGGIRTSGTMTITDSTIEGNDASTSGGGIALDGDGSTLSLTGTAVNNNSATVEGGGMSIAPNTSASVTQSSITRNDAGAGGGVSNGGVNSISNSTVSTNTATTQGAGILTSGNLTVNHATIHANAATGEGGGIRVIGVPTVTLTGTILYGNTGGSGDDCSGPLDSGGYNLVGIVSAPCVYTGDASDLPALSDPMLGPLTAGSPEYHPLMAGSDAIDAGAADCGLAVDQNGVARPDGPACDVGAVEAASPVMADEVLLVEPNGRWHIRVDGNPDYTFFYGVPGDVPLFGDWDGDGVDTPGMYRPSNGFAYLTDTLPPDGGSGIAEFDFFYGIPGDQVFVGDWDGINGDSLGISRNGKIFLRNTNDTGFADVEFWFGVPTDIAFGADTDGDGQDSVMVYRQSNSFAYYTNDTSMDVAPTDGELFFGIPGDQFVVGDWDRDGIDTPGVFRSSNTTVYLKNDLVTGPADVTYVWGTGGWRPVAGVSGAS
ncbi:MAG: hypothetical protein KJO87_06595, partial [Acidimicrobiia bacterium]|nr:hypothetical protein [Acidimicrobiia bacterium]